MTHPKNPLRELGFDLPLILYGFDDLPNGGYFVKKVPSFREVYLVHNNISLPYLITILLYIPWIIKNIGII